MISEILQLLPFAAFIGICFIIYRYAKNEGKIEGKKEFARKIRDEINEQIIEPWSKSFRSNFYNESENSYAVDDELIKSCLELAKQLYKFKQIFPDDNPFEKTFKYKLKDYICSCMNLDFSKNRAYTNLDPYFGDPKGYVDAFISIIEMNNGNYPKEIWLNKKTGSITIDPSKNETYRKIILLEKEISKSV